MTLPIANPDNAHGARRSARWKLLGLAVILSLPVAVTYWAYLAWRPQGQLAYGELIQPARPVGDAMATDIQGKPLALATLKGQWLLIRVHSGSCGAACQRQLAVVGQFRETLGKDQDRVDLVWLVNDNAALDESARGLPRGTWVLRVTPDVVQQWLGVASGGAPTDDLYVVDPLGHAMARFPARFDGDGARQMRRVLERLLRASVAWDSPGR